MCAKTPRILTGNPSKSFNCIDLNEDGKAYFLRVTSSFPPDPNTPPPPPTHPPTHPPQKVFGNSETFKRVPLPAVVENLSRLLKASIVLFWGRWGLPVPFKVWRGSLPAFFPLCLCCFCVPGMCQQTMERGTARGETEVASLLPSSDLVIRS